MALARRLLTTRRHLENGAVFRFEINPGYHLPGGKAVYRVGLFTSDGARVAGVSIGTFRKLRRCKLLFGVRGSNPLESEWIIHPEATDEKWAMAGRRQG